MKYLKSFNESNISLGYNIVAIVAPIRSEIDDILVEFRFGYDVEIAHYETLYSKNNFQLQILPKGYPDYQDIDPILIDSDILVDLRTVISFIKLEIGFNYSHSYYYENHKYDRVLGDIFTSEGKFVTMIQMFFTGPNDLNESIKSLEDEDIDDDIFVDNLVSVCDDHNLFMFCAFWTGWIIRSCFAILAMVFKPHFHIV